MKLTELRCKSCAAPLSADRIDQRLSVARCGHCNAVFAIELLGESADHSMAAKIRPKVGLPRGIEIEDFGTSLEIRRRWFSPTAIFLVVFAVMWNTFMIFWHGMAIASGAWFMSLFGLLHTAVGIGVAYSAAASMLNTTRIKVEYGMLEVKIGPIPWRGNKSLPQHDIKQIFCQEKEHRSKNGTRCTYGVMYVGQDNVKETLVSGLENSDQAFYIEQELERFLRIEDQAVSGEIR